MASGSRRPITVSCSLHLPKDAPRMGRWILDRRTRYCISSQISKEEQYLIIHCWTHKPRTCTRTVVCRKPMCYSSRIFYSLSTLTNPGKSNSDGLPYVKVRTKTFKYYADMWDFLILRMHIAQQDDLGRISPLWEPKWSTSCIYLGYRSTFPLVSNKNLINLTSYISLSGERKWAVLLLRGAKWES